MHYRNLLMAAAAAAVATPALAAPVGPDRNADGEVLILVPLTITKIDDLDFGMVVSSAISGTVAINAVTGARSVAGGVTAIPADAGYRALFATGGSPNQQVVVTITAPAALLNANGDSVPVLALTLDGSPLRTIDPVTRTFSFGVGGIITIGANQPEGVYQSIFTVTANYL